MSLTGLAAVPGADMRSGAELAVEVLNANRSNKIELVVQDDQSDPKAGVSGFNQLIDSEKVRVVVGPGPSTVAVALKPIANDRKVILMAPGVSAPVYATPNGYTFRTWLSIDQLEASTAKYATAKLGLRKVAVLLQDSTDARAAADAGKKGFLAAGGAVVGEEFVQPGQSDFQSQLTKLVATSPDALYIFLVSPASLGNAVKQARQLGFKGQILVPNPAHNSTFLEAAGPASEGAIWTSTVVPDPSAAVYQKFLSAYRTKFGKDPHILAANAYDCVAILVKAIDEAGQEPEKLAKWLRTLKDYAGVSGTITFNDDGNVVGKPFSVFTVKDSKFVALP